MKRQEHLHKNRTYTWMILPCLIWAGSVDRVSLADQPFNPVVHDTQGPHNAQGGLASRPPGIVLNADEKTGKIDVCWGDNEASGKVTYDTDKMFGQKFYHASNHFYIRQYGSDFSKTKPIATISPGTPSMLVGFTKDRLGNYYTLIAKAEFINVANASRNKFQSELEHKTAKTVHGHPQQVFRKNVLTLYKHDSSGKVVWSVDLNQQKHSGNKPVSRSNPFPIYGALNAGTGRLTYAWDQSGGRVLGFFTRRDVDRTYHDGGADFHQTTTYFMVNTLKNPNTQGVDLVHKLDGSNGVSHSWDQRILPDTANREFTLWYNFEHAEKTMCVHVVPFDAKQRDASKAQTFLTLGMWMCSGIKGEKMRERFNSLRNDNEKYGAVVHDNANEIAYVVLATEDGKTALGSQTLPATVAPTAYEKDMLFKVNAARNQPTWFANTLLKSVAGRPYERSRLAQELGPQIQASGIDVSSKNKFVSNWINPVVYNQFINKQEVHYAKSLSKIDETFPANAGNQLCRRLGIALKNGSKPSVPKGVRVISIPSIYVPDESAAPLHRVYGRPIKGNDTFLHLGNPVKTKNGYLVFYAESTGGTNVDAPHNLRSRSFSTNWDLNTANQEKGAAKTNLIPDYKPNETALCPRLVKISDSEFIALWEKWTKAAAKWSHDSTWAMKLNAAGEKVGQEANLGKHRLSRGDDAVLQVVSPTEKYVVWATGQGSDKLVFNRLKTTLPLTLATQKIANAH